jgi:hypothetical protein
MPDTVRQALHLCPPAALLLAAATALALVHAPAHAQTASPAASAAPQEVPANNYPTSARVEYVGGCMARNGGDFASMHKCSCVIDRIANKLRYDDFVEAATFSRYATLGGEGGAIFRDPEEGKREARLYRDTEKQAEQACGISPGTQAGR